MKAAIRAVLNQLATSSEATGDLIGNKIANKITKFSRTSSQDRSETVTNETENIRVARKILKER